jgi:hypothetical protein
VGKGYHSSSAGRRLHVRRRRRRRRRRRGRRRLRLSDVSQ